MLNYLSASLLRQNALSHLALPQQEELKQAADPLRKRGSCCVLGRVQRGTLMEIVPPLPTFSLPPQIAYARSIFTIR